MEARTVTELKLSRLMLGTVQFGQRYGIANCTGQPTYEEVRRIVALAYEGGVNCLDTAASYGSSEEVLGRALAELGLSEKMIVLTKIVHLKDGMTPAQAEMAVEKSVVLSLKRLRLETLPVCSVHLEQNIQYADALRKLKGRGLIRHIGISTVSVEAAGAVVASGNFEALQVPLNILDRRFMEVTSNAAHQGLAVFARSVYLQGLLLLLDRQTPPHLREIAYVRSKLRELAREAGMTLGELAMRHVLGIKELSSVLVGVDSVAQIKQNLNFFSRGPLDAGLEAAISNVVPDLPERIINPLRWGSPRPDGESIDEAGGATLLTWK